MTRGLLLISMTLVSASSHAGERGKTVWPTRGWTVVSPEVEGMDGAALTALHEEFAKGKHGYVDGFVVLRHGRVVFEKSYDHDYDRLFVGKEPERGPYNYYDPDWHPYYKRGGLHTLQSVSKSVTSALIGIALRREEIPSVDVKILPYFKGFRVPAGDPRREAMTLRHLLTMTSGIRWDESTVAYTDPRNSCAAMEASADWVQFVLDLPMAEEPGRVFVYNSGVTELLAQVLKGATGRQADEYAAEHLFRPLGITASYWKRTPTGLPDTEGGLYLSARDLAKIGYLYLNDGVWEGQRILPEGWVRDSTAATVKVSSKPGEERSYGYQWWTLPYGPKRTLAFAALGYGGQLLLVVPEYDLIAVFTGWNIYDLPALSSHFALDRVLKAVKASGQRDGSFVPQSSATPPFADGHPHYATVSLCAIDPATGESGVVVTTRVPFVGRAVPWAQAGVGAVATQAWTVVEYGKQGLDLLEQGLPPEEVIERLLTADKGRERRQIGIIDMKGRTAAHTGKDNGAWAGHRQGRHYTVQGNILVGPEVVNAVADLFERTEGTGMPLAERLILALEAGHRAGGDRRWGLLQSAALRVADPNEPGRGGDHLSVAIDVGEHPQPVEELKRIYRTTSQRLGYRALSELKGRDVAELKRMLHALGLWRPDLESFPKEPASRRDPSLIRSDPERFRRESDEQQQALSRYLDEYGTYDAGATEAVDAFRRTHGLDYAGNPRGLVDERLVDALREAYYSRLRARVGGTSR